MLAGQTVLITGGTGSFGRAFIRHVLATEPGCRLVSMSRNAEMRYRLEQAHLEAVQAGRLVVAPGDVRQMRDLAALDAYRPDVVIHAAAEKHVGTGERFTVYTWDVNHGGALNVIDLAAEWGAKVLALSTDKATTGLRGEPPANEYGLSKQAAERAFLRHGAMLVRYGNVVSSSGSVLPLFQEQRRTTGVLTLTDRRMTRFAMNLSSDAPQVKWGDGTPATSAVELVLDALAHYTGGAIFVPCIPAHSVADLAEAVGQGCEIREVGIRPGERLHEVLISPCEASRTWTRHGGWVILPDGVGWAGGQLVPEGFHYSSDQQPLAVEYAA